ncbi:hypothetical protein LEM8419_00009 [Neolewinella maritima]|uniref:Molybdopterin guanine dinucleotide synthesis n=1 Tax=Neolewinella maritima TaxID=1383882 RepID=A0ABM9AWE3_9BACT|nr:hypothetical protein [Neolewinella maritima]CAH0998664.1 hypothetical protein LEM8419_00009 [Neolewinella maritima]
MFNYTHYIAIDWSARNQPSPARPTKDAIWVAESATCGPARTHYFRTRHACAAYLEQRLIELRHERVLVGWDFSFGYPEGFAAALGLEGTPAWRAVWKHITGLVEDTADNRSNRFAVGALLNEQVGAPAGPFWGVPAGQRSAHLHSTRTFRYPVQAGHHSLPERRLVETLHPRMQPAWKLAYTGSVGSQTLLGIPYLLRLRDHAQLRRVSRVWPFEGGAAGAHILHAEIYPSLLPLPKRDAIPDREQVRSYVAWLRERQAAGELRSLLERPWGEDVGVHNRVTQHEGWILGIKGRVASGPSTPPPHKVG